MSFLSFQDVGHVKYTHRLPVGKLSKGLNPARNVEFRGVC